MRAAWLSFMLLIVCGFVTGAARADTAVKVIDTWPQGRDVSLGRNQDFYLRLAYATDKPVRIWARPYFQGRPANAGSNPSSEFNGTGESFGWFFLSRPDAEVDEVRITAGDGRPDHTPVVADYRVHVTGNNEVHDDHNDPAWVVAMKAQAAQAQRRDYQARMNAPVTHGDIALVTGFMLAVGGMGLLSLALPAWGLWKWRGGWRIAAAAPAALMAFVVLRIAIDTARDPTSHNLWPFEILMMGTISAAVMMVLLLVRKAVGGGR